MPLLDHGRPLACRETMVGRAGLVFVGGIGFVALIERGDWPRHALLSRR